MVRRASCTFVPLASFTRIPAQAILAAWPLSSPEASGPNLTLGTAGKGRSRPQADLLDVCCVALISRQRRQLVTVREVHAFLLNLSPDL
jgi:hypothetical protein